VAQPNPSEGDVTSFWYYRKLSQSQSHQSPNMQSENIAHLAILPPAEAASTLILLSVFHLQNRHTYHDAATASF
jgi:hypothetical protein